MLQPGRRRAGVQPPGAARHRRPRPAAAHAVHAAPPQALRRLLPPLLLGQDGRGGGGTPSSFSLLRGREERINLLLCSAMGAEVGIRRGVQFESELWSNKSCWIVCLYVKAFCYYW